MPKLDVADVDGRRVVGMDGEPGINLFWIGRARQAAAGDCGSLRAENAVGEKTPHAESDDQRAAGLQKFASRQQ